MTKTITKREEKTCPACNGNGKSYGTRYCSRCHGRGTVIEKTTWTVEDDG